MHGSRWMAPLIHLLVATVAAIAQTSTTHKGALERVEWTWAERPATLNPALPNVLLVGDSITRAYFPDVVTLLAGKANVYLFATSACSGDPRLPTQLNEFFTMEHLTFSVIHFNNGMHGWEYSEAEYSAGLPALVRALQQGASGSTLIWASTTPVHTAADFGASNERINARNAAALSQMKSAGIPVDDQNLLMSLHDDLHRDNVHYKSEGSQIQAKQVAQVIGVSLLHGQR